MFTRINIASALFGALLVTAYFVLPKVPELIYGKGTFVKLNPACNPVCRTAPRYSVFHGIQCLDPSKGANCTCLCGVTSE
jgi:hypothetical protein